MTGISANFVLIAQGLHYISPTTTQVLWQISPFTMIVVGVLVFKDRMTAAQKIGLVLLLVGLLMFLTTNSASCRVWARMRRACCCVRQAVWYRCVMPWRKAAVGAIRSATDSAVDLCGKCRRVPAVCRTGTHRKFDGTLAWVCFVYCCLNTLIGYGSFGEALKHWEASKVSAVTTLLPVFTVIFSLLGHYVMPDTFAAPDMNGLGYVGALVVVGGAVTAAVGTGCSNAASSQATENAV